MANLSDLEELQRQQAFNEQFAKPSLPDAQNGIRVNEFRPSFAQGGVAPKLKKLPVPQTTEVGFGEGIAPPETVSKLPVGATKEVGFGTGVAPPKAMPLQPVGAATEIGPIDVANTAGLDKGLRGPQLQTQPLGAAGPQYNRTSFQGPMQPVEGIRPPSAPVRVTPPVAAPPVATPTVGSLPTEGATPTAGPTPTVGPAAATGAAPAAEAAGTASTVAQKGSTFRRALDATTNAAKAVGSGSFLDADVGTLAAKGIRGLGAVANSPFVRALAPVGLGAQAYQTATTPTEQYEKQTGVKSDGSFWGDVGTRGLGTLQDIGNAATFGVADRVGNLIAGNGFNRSPAFQDAAAPTGDGGTGGNPPPPADKGGNAQGQPGGSIRSMTPTDSTKPNPGDIYARSGNSFSDGSQLGSKSGYGVSVVGDAAGRAYNAEMAAKYDRDNAGTPGGFDASGGSWVGHTSGDDTRARNLAVGRSNQLDTIRNMANGMRDPHAKAALMGQYANLAGQTDIGDAGERIAGLRERGETTRSIALNNTSRMNNANANAVSLRNNQETNATHRDVAMMPFQVQAAMRARMADYIAASGQGRQGQGDQTTGLARARDIALSQGDHAAADEFSKQLGAITTQQGAVDTQATARENEATKAFAGAFMRPNKDGTGQEVDPDAAAYAARLAKNFAPGLGGMNDTQRAPVMRHITALTKLMMGGLGADTKVGWRGLNPFAQPGAPDVAPPDIKDAQIERIGNVEGAVWKGASGGDYVVTTKEGKQYRLRGVDSDQLSILKRAIEGGGYNAQVSR